MSVHDNERSDASVVRHLEVGIGEEGQRIDNFLLARSPGVPRSHLYKIIRKGEVRVNGGRVKPTRKLVAGEKVRVPPLQLAVRHTVTVPDSLCQACCDAIVMEHDDFIVINKPEGVAVHAGSGLPFGVIDALRQALNTPQLELVHRLDRGTSGALLIARERGSARGLQAMFRQRTVHKAYRALATGHWTENVTVQAPLEKNQEVAGERRVRVAADGMPACSHFEVRGHVGERAMAATDLTVVIETGRTHQIRVHAQHQGHALVGDTRYGDKRDNARFRQRGLGRLFLHSELLKFDWQGESIAVTVDAGATWKTLLAKLD